VASFMALATVVIVLACSSGLRIYFANKLGERVVVDLRRALYDHVLRLDAAQFLKIRMGEVISRMTTDMTLVETMVGTSMHVTVRALINLLGSLALMMVLSPRFTFLVILLLPVVLAPLFLWGRRVRRLSRTAQDRFGETIGYASESLDALETVQAFGRERAASTRFRESIEQAFQASKVRIRARAVMTTMLIILMFGGVLGILFQSALDVFVHHTMTGGTLLQLLMLSMYATQSVRELGEVSGEVQRASGAIDRIGEMLDAVPAIAAPARPTALPSPGRGDIEFRDVSFSYPGREDASALNGFSLHIRPGERVALVGASGAGKSTVLRLLLRFYDPQGGQILMDGVDIRSADPHEVRSRMALVAQEAHLFSGSASFNIGFGLDGPDLEAIRAAARAAQAETFLDALPQGFDTPVGERGKTLSGGQRQRVAIARALIRQAPVLLLDEATSALDAENERLVQIALEGAMTGRTTLIIAHRLATVLEADRIVVMDRGRVVEEGRHSDLMAKGGAYARVARLQFGDQAA
jgi:ATP-binding cassette subfamily B protein